MIFGECLSSIGVPFEVLGHSTTHIEGHKTWAACPASLRKLYTRWGGTIIEEYKTFDESWKAVAPRIMEAKVCHNTHDAEAVKLASNRLLARKDVTRRIVFMLDDGQPFPNVWRPDLLYIRDDPDFYEKSEVIAKHAEALRRSVLDSEAAGIEVIGIGMGDDSVSKFYTNHLVVHNTKEFSKLFIEKLKTILLLKKR
jgi:cobalamin biosynthesis protein CobT